MGDQEHMEGFICPICMVDLCTLSLLLKHFESSHAEDKALVDQLKGCFLIIYLAMFFYYKH